MRELLLNWASTAVDSVWGLKTYRASTQFPPPKIIAHRGAWDRWRMENTLPAFNEAQRLGAWGIEFDVHFTRDGVPVINHDKDLLRCHGHNGVISELDFQEMRRLAPHVPKLEEVLALQNVHFFIEIKTFMSPEELSTLNGLLNRHAPNSDFHLLALDDQLVRLSERTPPESWILVGELALKSMVETSLSRKLGGVAGHFLGMSNQLREQLHSHGQIAGVGFVPTVNLYRREWSRGMDWAFTNSMGALQNAETASL